MPFVNTAVASGDQSADGNPDGDTTDDSVDGNDPDPNEDGNPDESSPTPITPPLNPVIGAAKQAGTVIDNGDATFTVPFTLVIENKGNIPLYDIDVTEDLNAVFGTHVVNQPDDTDTYRITSPGLQMITNTDDPVTINPSFTGQAPNTNLLLTGLGGTIEVGEKIVMIVTVQFYPDMNEAIHENQIVASGDAAPDGTPDGDTVDSSDDGLVTDTDGDGNPNESGENDPTPVPVPIDPVIGVAKSASEVIDNDDGTFTTTFTFNVENLGNVHLYDVSLIDDLTPAFGGHVTDYPDRDGEYNVDNLVITTNSTNHPLTVNPNFNGDSDPELFDVAAGGELEYRETVTLEFTLTFFPDLDLRPYENNAVVSGDTTQNGTPDGDVTDNSVDGTDPDPDGNGDPEEESPTPIDPPFGPKVGIAKSATDPIDNDDGTFSTTFNFVVKNFGNVPLYDVAIDDDLTGSFGTVVSGIPTAAGEYQIESPVVITTNSVRAWTANGAYDGENDVNLIDTMASVAEPASIEVNETIELTFTLRFFPDLTKSEYINVAIASGDTDENGLPDGNPDGEVTDTSTNGSNPDPDDDDNPVEEEPTPVVPPINPEIGIAKMTIKDTGDVDGDGNTDEILVVNNEDGTFTLEFVFTLENFGNIPLYDVSITDDLTGSFGSYVSGTPSDAGQYTLSNLSVDLNSVDPLTVNANFNGDSDPEIFDLSAGGSLAVNEVATVSFDFTFYPDFTKLPFINEAVAAGDKLPDGNSDGDATDNSVDGNDPDPDGNDDPTEESPTPIDLPIVPPFEGAFQVVKKALVKNVEIGQQVPYEIRIKNISPVTIFEFFIVDQIPGGFKYLNGSATLTHPTGVTIPVNPDINALDLSWNIDTSQLPPFAYINPGEEFILRLKLIVGANVDIGKHVNKAFVRGKDGTIVSNVDTAVVERIPEPVFDCSEIIGKVYHDRNSNGYQDRGESGIAGVRLATVNGQLITTDQYGRYHVGCAMIPNKYRGSNFILKLDERTLPTGHRLTTENPRVVRLTRGKMTKLNFGTSISRVVKLELDDRSFSPKSHKITRQLAKDLKPLFRVLRSEKSVLRLVYRTRYLGKSFVNKRVDIVQKYIEQQWKRMGKPYDLEFEIEMIGGKPSKSGRPRIKRQKTIKQGGSK